MAKMPQSDRVVLKDVRASYAHVFQPRENDRGEQQFSCTMLLPKSNQAEIDRLKSIAKGVAELAFGPNFAEEVKAGRLRWPFRDGDREKPDDPNYAGHVYLNGRNTTRPQIVDQNVEPILTPEGFGSGDYCNISGRFFTYNNKSRGVGFSLGNIQLTRRGERLDNRVDAKTDFDKIPGGESGGGSVPGAGTGYDDL